MRRLNDDLKEVIDKMNAASRQQEASADPVSHFLALPSYEDNSIITTLMKPA